MDPYRIACPPAPEPTKCEGDSGCYREVLYRVAFYDLTLKMCSACAYRYWQRGHAARLLRGSC